jgi:hypothetical protein
VVKQWCLHCERVAVPTVDQYGCRSCGYEDCDGGFLDLYEWLFDGVHGAPGFGNGLVIDEFSDSFGPLRLTAEGRAVVAASPYPVEPQRGIVYPLYVPKDWKPRTWYDLDRLARCARGGQDRNPVRGKAAQGR